MDSACGDLGCERAELGALARTIAIYTLFLSLGFNAGDVYKAQGRLEDGASYLRAAVSLVVAYIFGVSVNMTTYVGRVAIFVLPPLAYVAAKIALGYALIPTVSSAYWIFSVITTQVYLIMYLLMFVAAVQLRRKHPDHPRGYRAPMLIGMCGIGFAASLAALLVGFIPPSQFAGGNAALYFLIVAGGALGLELGDQPRREARPVGPVELDRHAQRAACRLLVQQIAEEKHGDEY